MTTEETLTRAGEEFVKRIQDEFDVKKLNDTGAGRASISYTVSHDKLVIEGLARVLFLVFGRRSGNPPPFSVIRDWVERKLDVAEEEIDGVAWAIVNKIAKKGTDILTDRAKGLQLEIILASIYDDLAKLIINFEHENIMNGLFDTWKRQTIS